MVGFAEPYPFRFNPWKHHLDWICNELRLVIGQKDNMKIQDDFINNIKSLNSNQIDIYTGKLEPIEIIEEIKLKIDFSVYQNRSNLEHWLNKQEYKLIELSDTSVWVLREGQEDDRYIHIHPARMKPFSIRIHGNSLKTAILYKLLFNNKAISLEDINLIRSNYLDLSPVKDLKTCERINNTIAILNRNITINSKHLQHHNP